MKFGKFWIFDLDNTLHNAAPHISPRIIECKVMPMNFDLGRGAGQS